LRYCGGAAIAVGFAVVAVVTHQHIYFAISQRFATDFTNNLALR